jgi:hypothetical protein
VSFRTKITNQPDQPCAASSSSLSRTCSLTVQRVPLACHGPYQERSGPRYVVHQTSRGADGKRQVGDAYLSLVHDFEPRLQATSTFRVYSMDRFLKSLTSWIICQGERIQHLVALYAPSLTRSLHDHRRQSQSQPMAVDS